MKKAATIKKMFIEKQEKECKKSQSKNQFLNIRRLVLSNSNTIKIGTFKDEFLDPFTSNSND